MTSTGTRSIRSSSTTRPTPRHAEDCTSTGTTGKWNGATGNSGGYQDWEIDLSAYAGKQVEVSITYVQDFAVSGLGVFLDRVQILKNGAVTETQGFETGLAPWVAGPQPAGTENAAAWIASPAVGFTDGPGIATDDTLLWGFGLEGITTRAERTAALKDAITYLTRSKPPSRRHRVRRPRRTGRAPTAPSAGLCPQRCRSRSARPPRSARSRRASADVLRLRRRRTSSRPRATRC